MHMYLKAILKESTSTFKILTNLKHCLVYDFHGSVFSSVRPVQMLFDG